MPDELTLTQKCRQYLDEKWNKILIAVEDPLQVDPLSNKYKILKENIKNCLTSKTKTYRYVLPTQILSKSVDNKLDCRSLQTAYEGEGAFDARTIAHKVIVPFDKANHNVLGGSQEPYVNNPLRHPSVTGEYRPQQKNKEDWDKLIFVLDKVQENNDIIFTRRVFDQILFEINNLLDEVSVVYPVPNRISLEQTISLINTFIAVPSGGDRLEAVATSLFRTISERFQLFESVKRQNINAPDAASGMVADIECWLNGKIVLLIEVKDRSLSLTQLDTKVDLARANKIKEIIFMAQQGVETKNLKAINSKISQEFTSGQNIYISNLVDFAKGLLILIGEQGRVEFISKIGPELDTSNSAIVHRKAWASLLKDV